MLKNKALAVFLSVLALALIAYRLFFDTSEPRANTQKAPPPLGTLTEQPPKATLETALWNWDDPKGGLILDSESPLLLSRVVPSGESLAVDAPLSPLFGLEPFVQSGGEGRAEMKREGEPVRESLELNGIVIDGDRRWAIVNRTLVQEGDRVGSYQVVKISPGSVLCQGDGIERVLNYDRVKVTRRQEGG